MSHWRLIPEMATTALSMPVTPWSLPRLTQNLSVQRAGRKTHQRAGALKNRETKDVATADTSTKRLDAHTERVNVEGANSRVATVPAKPALIGENHSQRPQLLRTTVCEKSHSVALHPKRVTTLPSPPPPTVTMRTTTCHHPPPMQYLLHHHLCGPQLSHSAQFAAKRYRTRGSGRNTSPTTWATGTTRHEISWRIMPCDAAGKRVACAR